MKNKLFLATMAAAMAVPAIVVPIQAEAKAEFTGFKDVPKTYAFYDVIMEMHSMDIIKGYHDNTFRPTEAISRMHVASLIDRAIDLEPVRGGVEFKDVPKTHPYYNVIQKLQRAGVVDGSGNGNFGPNDSLTRVQMAKILTLAFDLEVKAEYDFPDVPESHWGNKYVRALYSNGITFGDGGKFNPNQPVSRAHYAAFLHRLLNLDEDFVAPPIEQPKPDPKPEVKPEKPKPEVKPDPKPEPEKPSKPGYDYIPTPEEAVKWKPAGWDKSVVAKHKQQALNAAKDRPGEGSFGITSISLDTIRTTKYLDGYLKGHLKDLNTKDTVNDWIAGLNYALKTGKAYTSKDNAYTIYVEYFTNVDHTTLKPYESLVVHIGS